MVVKSWPGPRGPVVCERVVLEALAATAAADLVPRVVAATADGSLLVTSDLGCGPHERLGEILEGADRDAAEQALLAHARALGRLHAATAGAPAIALAEGLSAARPFEESRHTVHALDAHLAHLPERLREAGAGDAAESLDDEVRAARDVLAHPGPHLAITHGDATPANCYAHGDVARLFDRETAAARHAATSGTAAICNLPRRLQLWIPTLACGRPRRNLGNGVGENAARSDVQSGMPRAPRTGSAPANRVVPEVAPEPLAAGLPRNDLRQSTQVAGCGRPR